VLFWKPHVALFVNEPTLLPVLMPFAPGATLLERFPAALTTVLEYHGINHAFIEREATAMTEYRLAKTKNRSVVGIMNEFAYLAGIHRASGDGRDLVALSSRLAETPCSPLYATHVSPDRELAALVQRSPA